MSRRASGNEQRTTLVLDLAMLKQAQEVLGTRTARETVNQALHEVSRRAGLRRAAALVRAGGLDIVRPEDVSELRRVRP
ncbi:MAG: type II toxin-antitoxin system VapB family antitoxin [Mycobacteriales bacterium]